MFCRIIRGENGVLYYYPCVTKEANCMKEKTWLPGNISDRVCDLREEWGLTRKEPAPRSRALYSMGV